MTDDLRTLSLGELIEKMVGVAIEHDHEIKKFKASGREFIGTRGYESSLSALERQYHGAIKPYIDAINFKVRDDPGHS